MPKRPFIRKPKRRRHGQAFWDQEYINATHLALSNDPSGDLEKFVRWLKRQKDQTFLSQAKQAVDLGCGNGRNLIYLAKELGLRGNGYDTSSAAIAAAKKMSSNFPIKYEVRSIAEPITLAHGSQSLALDMMSSHFLLEKERVSLRKEIHRVLEPGGFLFMKTFLLDEDLHSRRLLKDAPGPEPNTYIHPVLGVPEHVYAEADLIEFLSEDFIVHKVYRSHKHRSKGKARKRRTISVYAQKDPYQ